MNNPPPVVSIPLQYPSSTFYLDDSGTKVASGKLLVIGGVKVRRHGRLLRAVRHVRDQTGFYNEFKFNGINKGSISAYYAMIDELRASDAHLVACVTSRPPTVPGIPKTPDWLFYADTTAQLVRGALNKHEVATVFIDEMATPSDVAFEDVVRGKVNRRLGSGSVVSAACLKSHASDGLQMADLVASAVAFERRRLAGLGGTPNSPKSRVVNRLKDAFGGITLLDCRHGRVNIKTVP